MYHAKTDVRIMRKHNTNIWVWLNMALVGVASVLVILIVGNGRILSTDLAGQSGEPATMMPAENRDNDLTDEQRSPVNKVDIKTGNRVAKTADPRPVSLRLHSGAPLPDDRSHWYTRGVSDLEWGLRPYAPAMDMAQTAQNYILAFSLPGIDQDGITVAYTNGLLSVCAIYQDQQTGTQYKLGRATRLPVDSQFNGLVQYGFSNGVLRVYVPRN